MQKWDFLSYQEGDLPSVKPQQGFACQVRRTGWLPVPFADVISSGEPCPAEPIQLGGPGHPRKLLTSTHQSTKHPHGPEFPFRYSARSLHN